MENTKPLFFDEYEQFYKMTGSFVPKETPSESFSKVASQIGKHFDCDEKSLRKVI